MIIQDLKNWRKAWEGIERKEGIGKGRKENYQRDL